MARPGTGYSEAIPTGVSRRRWLQLASMGGMALPACLGFGPQAAAVPARNGSSRGAGIRSCILLFSYGGPSQFETYDPKPNAPSEVRGEYGLIQSAVPGVALGECLPRMSRMLDRVALVRSVHHPMRNHNSAAAEVLTGRTPAGGDLELLADEARSFPTLGSAVSYGLGSRANVLSYVALPYTIYNVVQLPGQIPGLLGGAFDRFQVQANPADPAFRIATLEPPQGRQTADLTARTQLLHALNRPHSDETRSASAMRLYQERAIEMVASETVRCGFDISHEGDAVRDRYGRHRLGQSLLLARRLVENGVDFVTVFDGQHNGQEANWDSHQSIFPRHRQLIPPHDQAFSALIEDLEARGLLESTLIVSVAEFGRTPKINASAGRDHWPDCFTIALAGGGIRGGSVFGASDSIGAFPDRDPVTPADIAATIFWRFGIGAEQGFQDPTGRPWKLSDGQPLTSLFS